MFTGIIADLGTVVAVRSQHEGRHFRIQTIFDSQTIKIGASIACDGACHTVTAVGIDKDSHWFEVFSGPETLNLTTLGEWDAGRRINLERALRPMDELGGHLVSGHIDGLAILSRIEHIDATTQFTLEAPYDLAKFIATKGSIALNGTSLTVNWVDDVCFGVHLIPHTLEVTNWSELKKGDKLNLEIDQMARYAARLMHMSNAA